jgi:hypothetical protein
MSEALVPKLAELCSLWFCPFQIKYSEICIIKTHCHTIHITATIVFLKYNITEIFINVPNMKLVKEAFAFQHIYLLKNINNF